MGAMLRAKTFRYVEEAHRTLALPVWEGADATRKHLDDDLVIMCIVVVVPGTLLREVGFVARAARRPWVCHGACVGVIVCGVWLWGGRK